MPGRHINLPVFTAAFAAVIFGLWWVPIRFMESLGMHGAWAGLSLNAAAAVCGLVWFAILRPPFEVSRRALIGAMFAGVAATLYSTAIVYTDVSRAVLLFYLLPAWSKLIEWLLWKQPWRWTSTLAIAAALTGAYLVLGGEIVGGALNAGDFMAIGSGLAWGIGAAMIFSGGRAPVFPVTWVMVISAAVVAAGIALFEPTPTIATRVVPVSFGIAIIYILPLLALSLWSAQRLAPVVFSFLLTGELLSGVISSAIFLDEPFGWMQVAGAALIVLAAVSEIFSRQDVGELPLHSDQKLPE